jgi:tetratricopeptide (TPR) repeat protein
MVDPVTELLRRLAETQGDTHAQSALAAEFALAAFPEEAREPLRAALDAATVLRWFDDSLLAKLLGIPKEEAQRNFENLKALPFVEIYRSRDADLRNVHESTRLGWRKQLSKTAPDRFRALSAAAAEHFAENRTPAGRIEWVYHLLCSDPNRAASELESVNRFWTSGAHPEDRFALLGALNELAETALVQGRARVWVLLVTAWIRSSRSDYSQLAKLAGTAIGLAREIGDLSAEGDGQCLLGDVFLAQENLDAAYSAYLQSLEISQQLANRDRDNVGLQRELAVSHSRVGDVLKQQGRFAKALAEHDKCFAIGKRLAAEDPSKVIWQSDLAAVYGRIGNVLKALGRMAEAQAAIEHSQEIIRKLATEDPDNAAWRWDLALTYANLGDLLEIQENPAEARVAFGQYLSGSRRLVERDPRNAAMQRELAEACSRMASLKLNAGEYVAALMLYEEASVILALLIDQTPDFAEWRRQKSWVDSRLALCRKLASTDMEPGPASENNPGQS